MDEDGGFIAAMGGNRADADGKVPESALARIDGHGLDPVTGSADGIK